MDEMDRSQKVSELHLDIALRQHASRRQVAGLGALPAGPLVCVECGEPIPEARRRAVPGTRHCIECATRMERAA